LENDFVTDMLKNIPSAQEFFEKFSYTNKKEYVQWIESAKRAETRNTRLVRTIEKMLAEGKKSPNSK